MDHIIELIAQAEQDLIRTRDELSDARALVAMLEQDEKDMAVELTGLRSFAERHGVAIEDRVPTASHDRAGDTSNVVAISSAVEIPAAGSGGELLLMSRTEAVISVLRKAPTPLDRNAIHGGCNLGGRDDTLDQISLVLSGLKRTGRAERVGRGMWRLVGEEPATGS